MNCPHCGYKQEQSFVFCPQCGHQRVELPKPVPPQPTIGKVILILFAWLLGAGAASALGGMVAVFLGIYDMYCATPAFWGTLGLGLILNWKQRRLRIGFRALIIGLFIIPIVIYLLTSSMSFFAPSNTMKLPSPTGTFPPYPSSTPIIWISWSSVNMSHIGKSIYVTGIAYGVYPTNGGAASRIIFNDQPNAFFMLDQQGYAPDIRAGDCVLARGVVQQMNGQLYISTEVERRNSIPLVCNATPQPNSPLRPYPSSTPYVDTFRPITWMELQDFLAKDHTNWNKYTDEYVCVNFAMDLVANAKKQNINAWIVLVSFKDTPDGHAFVAFETTDKGIVWIDPQSDYSYRVVDAGKNLCSAVVDTNFCNFGVITEILQPAECNAVTHDCWTR